MTIRLASLLTTAALAVTVGLAGCSSQQPEAGAPAANTPASSAPADSAPASPSEAAPSADSSGKPAKTAIVAGLTAFYVKSQGLSREQAKKFATCMVDELYDKASTTTLKGLLAGDPNKIDKADAGLIAGAGNTCQSALS